MRRLLFAAIVLLLAEHTSFAQWKKIPGKISSSWSEQVDPANPLPEYPRPQMERSNWTSLNGLWNYAVTIKDAANASSWGGQILVPFAIESSLSGVGRMVGKDSTLWYNRKFSLKKEMKGKKILLHFGAVDWRTKVLVNGKEAGTHEGGFDPFTFDITSLLKKSGDQELTLSVWDPTAYGTPRLQAYGKRFGLKPCQTHTFQLLNPHLISTISQYLLMQLLLMLEMEIRYR